MAVRVILITGKGGVGKTTVSAATALASADQSARTLLVSTDAAHSLGDVLGVRLGPDPTSVAPNLDALHLEGKCELERSWAAIANYLRRVVGRTEIDHLHAEELLVLPGLDQLLALARLRSLAAEGRWDAIVVDCAPSADSLRLLALPDVLGFYLERLFGRGGTLGGWTRRRLERALAVPVPDDEVLVSVADLADEIKSIGALLKTADTTARIVVTPEQVVVAEGQRTLTYLALYGYCVDAVVVNRVLGNDLVGTPLAHWIDAQQRQLKEIEAAFQPLPRLLLRHTGTEPIGLAQLRELGSELYRDSDPLARLSASPALEIVTSDGESIVRVPIGGIDRADIGVERLPGELVITLAGQRRVVSLPEGLRDQVVRRAGVADAHLEVVFGGPVGVR